MTQRQVQAISTVLGICAAGRRRRRRFPAPQQHGSSANGLR